jgi:hypothetical protein
MPGRRLEQKKVHRMLFAVTITEGVLLALIAGFVTLVQSWMQRQTRLAVEAASKTAVDSADRAASEAEQVKKTVLESTDNAASKADEVKQTLQESTKNTNDKLKKIADVGVATHTLVNSNMAVQLKLHADTSRRLAILTHDETDMKAADLAEKLVREHEEKQRTVDAKEAKQQP